MGYLITFTTYGTWLHGNNVGSIWKNSKESNTTLIGSNPTLEKAEFDKLKNAPFKMNSHQRQIVLEAILKVCHFRRWNGYAVHVRSSHIHAIVSAKTKPERMMNDFKIYATRALRQDTVQSLPGKIWTRHGSTKYLWNNRELSDATNYVRDRQGKMMAFWQTTSKPRP